MEFKIKTSFTAKKQVDAAIKFYKSKSSKAAKKFNKTIDRHYKSIVLNPYHQIRYRDVRSFPVKDFPYIILYRIREDVGIIDILSVFCTHQDPEKYP